MYRTYNYLNSLSELLPLECPGTLPQFPAISHILVRSYFGVAAAFSRCQVLLTLSEACPGVFAAQLHPQGLYHAAY